MRVLAAESGFTLVELMVVVLIIAILVAIAVPIFGAAKGSAQQKTCFSNQRTIEGAAETYQATTGLPPSAGTINASHGLVTGGFIKSAPYCPVVSTTAYYSLNSSMTVTTPTGCTHGHY